MKGEVKFVHWASQRWMCRQEIATPSPDVLRGGKHVDARTYARGHVEEMSIIQAVAPIFPYELRQ